MFQNQMTIFEHCILENVHVGWVEVKNVLKMMPPAVQLFLYSKDNIRRKIIDDIGDIQIENEFNKLMVSTNLIIVNHEMSFENFEKASKDFIRLRTNGALSLLEIACLHYTVFIFYK
jgi:hypothetical protein